MGCVPSVLEFFSLDRSQQNDFAVAQFEFHGAVCPAALRVVEQTIQLCV